MVHSARRRTAVKFYDSLGPNPRLVRMFMLEKDITVPAEQVDIMGGANRQRALHRQESRRPDAVARARQRPRARRDRRDLRVPRGEAPEPALIGRTPEETRRDAHVDAPASSSKHHRARSRTASASPRASRCSRIACARFPRPRAGLKAIVAERPRRGSTPSSAASSGSAATASRSPTSSLYCGLDFGAGVGQARDPRARRTSSAWFERVGKRPSAEASIHPVAKAGGMRA